MQVTKVSKKLEKLSEAQKNSENKRIKVVVGENK